MPNQKRNRPNPRQRRRNHQIAQGQGAYNVMGKVKKAFKKRGKNMFQRLGGNLGTILGNQALGQLAGHGIDVLTGKGSYISNADHISKNALFGGRHDLSTNEIPVFGVNRESVTVRHREYIADVAAQSSSPSTFSNAQYVISASNSDTFPWLSQIAANFQEYQFLGLIFEFVSTSGVYTSSSQALGQVIMVEQTNPLDASFVNKFQMENYYGAISSKPADCIQCGCECDPKQIYAQGHLLCGSTVDPQHTLGLMNVATNAVPVGSTIVGELWVSYEVVLYQPLLATTIDINPDILYLHLSDNTTSDVTSSAPFGTNANRVVSSSSNLNFGVSGTTSLISTTNLPAGTAIMGTYIVVGGAAACADFTSGSIASTNCTLVNYWFNYSYGEQSGAQSGLAGQTQFIAVFVVQVTLGNTPWGITLTGATFPTNVTHMDFTLSQIPSSGY